MRIAAYLQSEGKSNDRTALLAGAFWIDPFQDGRRSKAMLALIEDLRVLIKRGKRVHVTLLDDPGAISANRDRDVIMADNLQTAFELSPTDVFIVLTGNMHSRIMGRSMGQLFARGMPALKVTALDVAFSTGSAWTCISGDATGCRSHTLRGSGDNRGTRVIMRADETGFNGVYNVGTITASPPAAGLQQ